MSKNKQNKNLPQPPKKQHQMTQAVVQSQHFSGPLPHPAILEQFNKIVPGAAERIILMAENQAKHRQELEKIVIQSDIRDGRLGLHYGLVIGVVGIIGATICIMGGHTAGGSILGGSSIASLAGAFIYGSRQRQNERETRLKAEIGS